MVSCKIMGNIVLQRRLTVNRRKSIQEARNIPSSDCERKEGGIADGDCGIE